jgi:molybdopterin converting factor small subunit
VSLGDRGRPGSSPGTVRVKFFASYAELVGRQETGLELALPATVADVVRRLREEFDWAQPLPDRPLAAVNLRQVQLDAPVSAGDEVALLPPLAGG